MLKTRFWWHVTGQDVLHNSSRYKRAPKGKKGKGKFDPQELDKVNISLLQGGGGPLSLSHFRRLSFFFSLSLFHTHTHETNVLKHNRAIWLPKNVNINFTSMSASSGREFTWGRICWKNICLQGREKDQGNCFFS